MTRSGSKGRRRAVAYLLAAATGLLWLGGPTPSTAAAAEPQLTFTMSSLKASGYAADDRVTLEGTVTNTGSSPAYGVQVILWRSRDPIQSLATLRQADANNILGSRLPISADHYVVVSTSTEPFAPGQTEVVTLRATMAELGFDTRGAAYALGADLIASPTAATATDYPTVGQLRTFLPVPGKKKVPVTPIVLLSAPPTKLVDNLFRDDSLAAELTGRLSSLLDTAAQPGLSWLIDPALLDAVRDMADGYEVTGADANTAGTGEAAAEAWLERFDRLDQDAGGRTLFANPDLDGARVAGDTLVVSRSERAAGTVDGLDDLPLVVVPAGGILTAASYDFLSGSEADLVLATNTVAAGALQAGAGDRPLVLGAAQTVPATAETPANLGRQLALAAAVVAGSRGEVRLLTTVADVEQDTAAMGGWLVRRDLDDLRDSAPSVSRTSLVATKPARLSRDQFERLHRLESDFTAHAELAPESRLTAQSDAAVSRAAASAWVGDATGFDRQLAGVAKLVGMPEIGRSVVLDASPRFVMSSRANQFPVTVTNNLTEPVQVKVVVTTDNPQRLTVPPSEVITVPPNQGVTVNIRLEATANGVVAARAYLATQSGHRVSPDTPITVEVTDIGIVAWIIVGVSGLVLVGATAWRIRQVRRRTVPVPTREVAG